ncbi:MAG: hypothetical protein ABIZ81_13590 [Opitutaceae bacterium]
MKRYPPLTFRGTLLFAFVAALLLSSLLCFLHREKVNEFSDYALIAGLSFGFMAWTIACLRINQKIRALSLVVRAFGFAFAMLLVVVAGAFIRRQITGELPHALADVPFPLFALMPLLPAFFGQPSVAAEEESGSSLR